MSIFPSWLKSRKPTACFSSSASMSITSLGSATRIAPFATTNTPAPI
eukprot:CAMPEP_0181275490 /NCGR_PEP_ID=MMETSP1097-20121128/9913_1 /TAXON_ID=35684 /ORGANISM="Pseudopedinella elastica, Strain CCMP716" /LENGTH=46 /DNA_ID= /DNA_START= /DNA_END= /DNA_ORIENTATION=